VTRFSAAGHLDGLLPLAVEKRTHRLSFAGAHQAEYHAWLALPGEETFIVQALEQLSSLGFDRLSFTYLPPGSPMAWLRGKWGSSAVVQSHRKPVMDIGDGTQARESLRKKSNKSRLSRLQRLGPLEFVQLNSPEELDRYYAEIIAYTDFRQGALHNSFPFANDPLKRSFFRELMRSPELTHATVLKAGDTLVSAHIGFRNGDDVTLGLICYPPFLSEYSPGKLHMLRLALLLHEQGVLRLDLTPGGDDYKDRFATAHEEVMSTTIFFNRKSLLRDSARRNIRSYAVRAAGALGVDHERALRYERIARRAMRNPARAALSIIRRLAQRLWSTTEMRFYRLQGGEIDCRSADKSIARNSVADLLQYQPAHGTDPSKQQFTSAALSRIVSGSHVYTYVADGRLVHFGWLNPVQKKSFITEVGCEYEYPPNTAVMWDFYTLPSYRGKGLYNRSLRRILADVAAIPRIDFVYIAVLAENWPSRNTIEKVGFKYQDSIVRKSRFGRNSYLLTRRSENATQ
jgi:CelD/BcsL family acetyltransferase involved in cellulose biosynthesis/GNAT superfamily N-acetyltransferase